MDVWNLADVKRIDAANEIDLLLERKLFEQRVYARFDVSLRLCRLAYDRQNPQ
jgi:hypothetical protein